MSNLGFVWECECGNIGYGEYPPQECSKCQAMESFARVPEDMVEKREDKNVLTMVQEELEEDED